MRTNEQIKQSQKMDEDYGTGRDGPDGPESACCNAPAYFADDGPVCTKCGNWTATKKLKETATEAVDGVT